jgi:hypothetical protein
MPFDYYQRLSKKDRKIYDASDAVARIDLGDPEKARAARRAVEAALAAEDMRAAGRAAQALANAICDDREVPRVVVRILAKRPKDDAAELHGLYVREEDEPAVIRVWMRTAERKQVVKPKTFLRTLLHEVIHHLDYELLKLADSFHTQGFYRREASLFRQLADADPAALPLTRAEAAPPSPPRRAARPAEQLSLFGEPTKPVR